MTGARVRRRGARRTTSSSPASAEWSAPAKSTPDGQRLAVEHVELLRLLRLQRDRDPSGESSPPRRTRGYAGATAAKKRRCSKQRRPECGRDYSPGVSGSQPHWPPVFVQGPQRPVPSPSTGSPQTRRDTTHTAPVARQETRRTRSA